MVVWILGPAECADPAEALESVNSRVLVRHASSPRGGGGFKVLARIPLGLRKVLPKGGVVLSFLPSSFDNFYQHRTKKASKSINIWTKLAPGGLQEVPTINNNMKK